MASPFSQPDSDFGTLDFPISAQATPEPDLSAAANFLYFGTGGPPPTVPVGGHDWPGEGGTADLPKTMSEYPDAIDLANYLFHYDPGATGTSWPAGPVGGVDSSGTNPGPYVDPRDGASPDAVLALNFLYDFL